jgi:hypothetical protein
MNTSLSFRKIFIFWVPLALMWMLMSVEQPLIAAALTRLADLKENLAAFGMSFSLAMVIQSPVIQLLSAGNVLVKTKRSYRSVLNFSHLLFTVLGLLHLLFCWPPLFNFVALKIIGVPVSIVDMSWKSFLFFLPMSAAVGYRRFWQGVLIGAGRTGALPPAMLFRLLVMVFVLAAGLFYRFLPGASLGALTMTMGVVGGGFLTFWYVRPVFEALPEGEEKVMSLKEVSRFYFPLAMTSIINMTFRPLLTIGLARAPGPLESLAVWPVLVGFVSLFRGVSISYQEVVIALFAPGENRRLLRKFGFLAGVFLSSLMIIMALWPVSRVFWFQTVSGLPDDLMWHVHSVLYLLAFIPFLSMNVSWFRGLNVRRKRTIVVTVSVAVNAFVLVVVLFALPMFTDFPGTVIVSVAYVLSLFSELLTLYILTANQKEVL